MGYTIGVHMKIFYSIIVPVMNESESLTELYQELKRVFSDLLKSYEFIFVDDGSTDTSLSILKELEKKHSEYSRLSKN